MNKQDFLADEVLMIADGGEMPEVAFNSSLYYLTRDEDGPKLQLSKDDLLPLKEAVVQRFSFIILRDLQPENRTKSIYRGLARSSANWFRLWGYCQREELSSDGVRTEAGRDLAVFLSVELRDVCEGGGASCINCSRVELEEYAGSLGLELDAVAPGWSNLFTTLEDR